MNKYKNFYNLLDKVINIIFIILIGLIFYTLYRSEIVYDGLYRNYYLKYYIFLISSFFILLFINFFLKKIKIQIYITVISIVIGLYISETFLIDFKNLKSKTKYEFYMDLKQTNDVVVSIFPFKYILKNINQKKLFPLSGISNKLTVYCKKKENKKFVTYKSDRFGFRNDDSNWDEINVDFVLLGDSFVQGSCVDSDSTINSQLSNIYNSKLNKKINTINLGLNGNGPLLEYAILKEYLKYTETEKVLYFFYEGNDLENFDIELNDPFLKKYLNYDFEQELIKKQADIDIINYNLLEEELNKKHIAFLDFIKLKKLRILINNIYRNYSKNQISKSSKETYKHYNNILVNLKKLTESQNTELYFIYMPYISRFSNYNSDQNYEDYSKIMSMVKKLDIKYIDILSKFKTEVQDPLSLYQLRKYQHLNESGYKFVAETIIKEIN